MLITSNIVRGRCPICGAPNCTCGGPSEVAAVDQRAEAAEQKGPLRRYDLGRGVSVQLTDEAARRAGLLGPKEPEAPRHKMRRPFDCAPFGSPQGRQGRPPANKGR